MAFNLLCAFGWHTGAWFYDDDPSRFHACAQTRTCPRCGNLSSRIRHDLPLMSDDPSPLTRDGVPLTSGRLGET